MPWGPMTEVSIRKILTQANALSHVGDEVAGIAEVDWTQAQQTATNWVLVKMHLTLDTISQSYSRSATFINGNNSATVHYGYIPVRWPLFPAVHVRRQAPPKTTDVREVRARETLRQVIGEQKWRRFLRSNFVTARGKSGKTYVLYPAHKFTEVYERGVLVERLCVYLSGDFPPTDHLIVRYLLVLNDERSLWERSVKHGPSTQVRVA